MGFAAYKVKWGRELIHKKYPDDFERLWKLFLFYGKYHLIGTLGPKGKALEEFRKLKLTEDDFEELMETIKEQGRWKKRVRMNKEFIENFPQVFRYLRDRRFEEEVPDVLQLDIEHSRELVHMETGTTEDNVAKRLQRLGNRDWAD